jgi:hypothetical protein
MHHRMGNLGQAQEHIAVATAMHREIGMIYRPEQAEAEMRQLGEPPTRYVRSDIRVGETRGVASEGATYATPLRCNNRFRAAYDI